MEKLMIVDVRSAAPLVLRFEVSPAALRVFHAQIQLAREKTIESQEPGRALLHDALLELEAAALFAAESLEGEPCPRDDAEFSAGKKERVEGSPRYGYLPIR